MSRRTSVACAVALAIVCGCARPHTGPVQEATVGHHHVRFILPARWEHLDHGHVQLFRNGEAQLTLADLGPASADTLRRMPDLLYQVVADRLVEAHGLEIAARERRSVNGHDWAVYELWNQVSHEGRVHVAFTVDEGNLLALTTDRGLDQQLAPAFTSLFASLEISPAAPH